MKNRVKRCLGVLLALSLLAVSVPVQAQDVELVEEEIVEEEVSPEVGDHANSWRYQDGELVNQAAMNAGTTSSKAWKVIDGVCYNSEGKVITGAIAKGIDVSHHNGTINWEKVQASDVSYAIIRCGYGTNHTSQDDRQWKYNADECKRIGMPFGVYLYSYAKSTADAKSEAEHVLRLVKGYNLSYPIYYDLEDSTQEKLGKTKLGDIAQTFCDTVEAGGYKTAIYANKYWFTSVLTDSRFASMEKWVAQYNANCTYTGSYKMWQCSSTGSVSGITGNVDLDFDYGAQLKSDAKRLVVIDGDTYCMKGEEKLYGKQTVNKKVYYFNTTTGKMVTGWITVSGEKYYHDENGVRLYGANKIDGKNYYLDPKTGAMHTGWLTLDNKKYYYNSSGVKQYGWETIDGKEYYLKSTNGELITDAGYLKAQQYTSDTEWLITINRSTKKISVFQGSKDKWCRKKYWSCSVGTSKKPTPKGSFVVTSQGTKYGTSCTYWYYTRFDNGCKISSVKYKKNSTTKILNGTIGKAVTTGPVRISRTNAKYIFDNVPKGTKVVVY